MASVLRPAWMVANKTQPAEPYWVSLTADPRKSCATRDPNRCPVAGIDMALLRGMSAGVIRLLEFDPV